MSLFGVINPQVSLKFALSFYSIGQEFFRLGATRAIRRGRAATADRALAAERDRHSIAAQVVLLISFSRAKSAVLFSTIHYFQVLVDHVTRIKICSSTINVGVCAAEMSAELRFDTWLMDTCAYAFAILTFPTPKTE